MGFAQRLNGRNDGRWLLNFFMIISVKKREDRMIYPLNGADGRWPVRLILMVFFTYIYLLVNATQFRLFLRLIRELLSGPSDREHC